MSNRLSALLIGTWMGASAAVTLAADRPTGRLAEATAPHKTEEPLMIDWDKLLPEAERAHFNDTPPGPVHDYLGEGAPGARQSGSAAVNRKLDATRVKIPGYVVPLVMDGTGVVTEFFLVPYLGACIHVPPPPPNQIVYVKLSKGGIRLGSLEDAYWVTGTLHTQINGTRVAKAAYTLDASKMEIYKY
jgi:uncharacterized protein